MSLLGFGPIADAALADEATGATLTTFSVAYGTFTLTGEAALFQPQLAAAYGSFTLTGESIAFTLSEVVSHGSFTLTGEDVTFQVQLAPAYGSFVLSGQDIIFRADLQLGYGSFLLSGFEVSSYNLPEIKSLLQSTEDRGFEETLAAFAHQRRKDREELEIEQLMAWEAMVVIEAIQPFTVVNQ